MSFSCLLVIALAELCYGRILLMTNSSDKDDLSSGGSGPSWPLDSIKSIGRRAQYFEKTPGLQRFLDRLLTVSPHGLSEPQICAHGWALVEALRPADYVGRRVVGDEAYDLYQLLWDEQLLQLALSVFSFAGQPPLVLVAIEPGAGRRAAPCHRG